MAWTPSLGLMGRDDPGRAGANSEGSVGLLWIRPAPGMKQLDSCKQEPGVTVPIVSLTRCEGKGDCVNVCPENVFRVQRIEQGDYRDLNAFHKFKLRVHGMQVAYTPNAEACRSCGLCVSACPERAITLERRGAP